MECSPERARSPPSRVDIAGLLPAAGDIAGKWKVHAATGTVRPGSTLGPAAGLGLPPEIPEGWRNLAIDLTDHTWWWRWNNPAMSVG